jgi:hypothetical protein
MSHLNPSKSSSQEKDDPVEQRLALWNKIATEKDQKEVQLNQINWILIPWPCLVLGSTHVHTAFDNKYTSIHIEDSPVDLRLFIENSVSETAYDSFIRRMKIAHANKENLFVVQTVLSNIPVYGCFFSSGDEFKSGEKDTVWMGPKLKPDVSLLQETVITFGCGAMAAQNCTISSGVGRIISSMSCFNSTST